MSELDITILYTPTFEKWFSKLRDRLAKARITARLRRLGMGNTGDVAPIGEGVSELRIHYGAGYRVYFIQKGAVIIIILCGGDKATQDKDIKLAKKLAAELKGKQQ